MNNSKRLPALPHAALVVQNDMEAVLSIALKSSLLPGNALKEAAFVMQREMAHIVAGGRLLSLKAAIPNCFSYEDLAIALGSGNGSLLRDLCLRRRHVGSFVFCNIVTALDDLEPQHGLVTPYQPPYDLEGLDD